jgi:hypothetical protein
LLDRQVIEVATSGIADALPDLRCDLTELADVVGAGSGRGRGRGGHHPAS